MLNSNRVVIASGHGRAEYPSVPPFRPASVWPELAGHLPTGGEENDVHGLLRTLLRDLGLDRENFGSAVWNPLGDLIRPGQQVVIKPNLVRHLHETGGDYRAVVTHGSVVRAIGDYVALALRGDGLIIIGDAPIQATDFSSVVERTGLEEVREDLSTCWKLPVRLADFRLWALRTRGEDPWSEVGDALSGDPDGYCAVQLGNGSWLTPLDPHAARFRVTCYDPDEMSAHHNPAWNSHEYLIAKAVLDADVVVNVPKLKTHHKVGLTAALKNLVGINGHKDWLPHHRCGSVQEGGDEYREPSRLKRIDTWLGEGVHRHPGSRTNYLRRLGTRVTRRLIRHFGADPFYEGSWYGNDTCWRMVLDLNRILFYADRDGRMTESVQRRTLSIVDGIVAGEGNGPMAPDPRHLDVLVAGQNPAAVDAVLATMIGFDYRRLPLVANSFASRHWPLVDFEPRDVEIRSSDTRFLPLRTGEAPGEVAFKPPSGWVGNVELAAARDSGR